MSRIDVGFVILHYLVEKETIECINTIIRNIDTNSYSIVVVDNNSNNGSYEKVRAKFCDNKNITFIHNDKNLGFAKGNNVGIEFLRRQFDVEFICCLNNDIELLEMSFYSKLKSAYESEHFAVAGPLILSGDGRYDSNPQRIGVINTIEDIEKKISRYRTMIKLIDLHLYRFYQFLRRIKGTAKNSIKFDPPHRENDVQLSGACLIFSGLFFSCLNGFFDKTFLYKEEDILRYQLQKLGLKSLFMPEIVVYHAEDASTDAMIKKDLNKEKFTYLQYINSLEEMKVLFKNNSLREENK